MFYQNLKKNGLLHYYVQQNHDGLPQKAGFPQEKLNEIHGAWYDPSNQVVKFSGSLRSDLFQWMAKIEKKIDLCICLGTSLSGMNADRMAWTPVKNYKNGKGNGTIMINLQKTDIDEDCTIRVWAKIDDAFKILMKKLDLDMNKLRRPPVLKKDIFYIPYDEEGKYLGKNTKKLMKLDFSVGTKIKIIHPDSSSYGIIGKVVYKYDDHYTIKMKSSKNDKEALYALGTWMIDQAIRGAVDQFSYANIDPTFIDIEVIKENDLLEDKKENKEEEKKEIEKEIKKDNFDDIKYLITIGNTHNLIDKENHKWKMYVISENDEEIEQVLYTLHPTFKKIK